jgi:hypothetical protein
MMANENRPMGLSPVNMITGAPYNGQARLYTILAANTNAFAIGDPVVTDPLGGDSDGVPAVTIAAATGAIRGVIVGIADQKQAMAKVGNLDQIIRPAGAKTTNWYVMVVDDPNIVFEVQEIGTGTPLAAADIGLNTNLVVGTNNGFVSGWLLDNATEAVTATLQVRILGLVQRSDNAFGAFAKWLVKINTHELAAGPVGV